MLIEQEKRASYFEATLILIESIITFIYIMRSMRVNIEGLPNDQTEDEENNNQQDGNEEVDRHYHKDESREEGVGVGVGEGGEGSFEEGAIEDEIEEERQEGRERDGEGERAKKRKKEGIGNEDGDKIEIKPQQQPHKEVECKETKNATCFEGTTVLRTSDLNEFITQHTHYRPENFAEKNSSVAVEAFQTLSEIQHKSSENKKAEESQQEDNENALTFFNEAERMRLNS